MEHVFSLGLENPGGTKPDSEHLQATDSASGTPAERSLIFEVPPPEAPLSLTVFLLKTVTELPSAHLGAGQKLVEKLTGVFHEVPEAPAIDVSSVGPGNIAATGRTEDEDVPPETVLLGHDLAGRIEATIQHGNTQFPPYSEGLVQSTLGGGSAGEESEEFEKAINFVQQHILQSHEPILEQINNEQMAKTIKAQYKHLSGRGFPSKKH
ncbi:hypothetical protein BDP27DRAFT_1366826 [Rhodocollybia butyracea]|uniref:Uncharacterized protein n=1 Tax=Rhodocollybia butyracea TaxID=206335 RepID=A0A9P5PJB0_9AGAR|nr:hypothetical protein BDP27DRAFT_1366826 [Rhodocollybia butyracea]